MKNQDRDTLMKQMEFMQKMNNSSKQTRCHECDDIRYFDKDGNFWVCSECGAKIR